MKLDAIISQGFLKDGKLVLNRKDLAFQLSRYENCSVKIIIERLKSRRTLKQLAYFFGGALPPISSFTGHTIHELYYNIFKPLYAPIVIKKWRGREIKSIKGLSEMSKGEAVEFINRVIAEASSMGIIIETPDEFYKRTLS